MTDTLLYILGVLAVGQTGLMFKIALSLGHIESKIPDFERRIRSLEGEFACHSG